ncbi:MULTISPECIES: 2-amino-4-hydroxy-6-hydroxymethyldihydropteridine diphosphokinase [Niallia]|jgi:2-amino-4-hydroxy-6-hydroxymethyldihydropteridine diphosphokinase|uniref:2-amino-4-hydroxy-6-hydroxymethyldihydropteridine diphosphokinase n=1 Tax=Niallia circulans TaxID=1397 RepID=A0A268F649_NIACI|nr:2-amino-4-hydroxy-6-hydroxymethyldihydropteridine diphosphokinase [Niallia circulans]AYV68823.1 2-amino-4-hydroxy-6-hydroxymethyldihydropteridine diphosphokinase [Niallia circulans]AYV72786.1 2-amino-4-hydroxy-6-hydroxymethyldihydropteridine diphosphokinase [Niallia circulans]NRG26090.1 2-amino-4-hydroxy-6-hydroxymethyldihydropteridine diphosphokinase [Niallia circulans]PAD80848.1 2-amino-4-hydroxy-6-hydroxymethyldihydropteridine diphosphokinase [Niallia circulans]QJX60301.1 2-amino-4-hydro
MNKVYLSLGSNIGDRLEYIREAVQMLHNQEEIKVVNISSVYETDPVGYEEQALFLNIVIQVETSLNPLSLLEQCQKIESELGRKRIIRWGPRTIDLDILLYNQENIVSEKLIIPHPRIEERAFVLVPLIEIAPDIKLPNKPILLKESLQLLRDREGVRVWKQQKNGEDVFALFES